MRTSGPNQPADFLLDVLDSLAALRIPYAVVGAFAASYYGVPRASKDVDALIWLKNSGRRLPDVADHLSPSYKVKVRHGEPDDPILGVVEVEDVHGNRVDLLAGVRGMDPDAVRRCVSTTLMGSPLCLIGAEDLIAMKVFAGGAQDLADVRRILQVSGPTINLDLLRKVARGYGSATVRKINELLKQP